MKKYRKVMVTDPKIGTYDGFFHKWVYINPNSLLAVVENESGRIKLVDSNYIYFKELPEDLVKETD